mmetsp:Transcript_79/g.174  ORF Transcript_79/g.174 Transcript_79/m.174 type:complete len:265 (-) Transcript_79:199-993(-)|eukprot:CAMPEP_0114511648 /NCGR_PEP_ID=MMETSP0109-20121206/14517_1 /TAXON_ID=29199 /ORGANISM="Chlorarachnion reptans, Strain CCCM449" /LENGTH=264 /DNA_ID=CAMNT_0001691205 /DNA_START=167 /DNA_END=961 /DNA_ORIENTATION=-
MSEKKCSEEYQVGDRVEACYKGRWYAGDLVKLPDCDPHGRYTVHCDCDDLRDITRVKVIRHLKEKRKPLEIGDTSDPGVPTDITIRFGDQALETYRFALRVASPVFRVMLGKDRDAEELDLSVDAKEVCGVSTGMKAWTAFLKCLVPGMGFNQVVSEETILGLTAIAHKYDAQRIFESAEEFILENKKLPVADLLTFCAAIDAFGETSKRIMESCVDRLLMPVHGMDKGQVREVIKQAKELKLSKKVLSAIAVRALERGLQGNQ